jgi:hypothetical protein
MFAFGPAEFRREFEKNHYAGASMTDRNNTSRQYEPAPSAEPAPDLLKAAEDPMTAPLELAQFSTSPVEKVRFLVALNPNTPLPSLLELWGEFPLAALQNPILDVQTALTAKPFHQLIPLTVQVKLYVALMSAGRIEEMENLLPTKLRKEWFCKRHYSSAEPVHVGYGFYEYLDEAPRQIEPFNFTGMYVCADPSKEVRLSAIRAIEPIFLIPFSTSPILEERIEVAKRLRGVSRRETDSIEERLRDALALDLAPEVRSVIASDACISPKIHLMLSNDPCKEVRRQLAQLCYHSSGSCIQGWESLAEQETEIVRILARNTSLPQTLRLKLTSHTDQAVRNAAWEQVDFHHRETQGALWDRLATLLASGDAEQELCVLARNVARPRGTAFPDTVASTLATLSPQVTRTLALNPTLSDSLRLSLMGHPDLGTAINAFSKGDANEFLHAAHGHADSKMREKLAGRKGPIASRLRKSLAKDESVEVRKAVAEHIRWSLRHHDGVNIQSCLATLVRDSDPSIRALVAPDHRLTCSDFDLLCSDPSPEVRLILLKTRRTEFHGHLGLLTESNGKIRNSAAREALDADLARKQSGTFKSKYAVDRVIANDSMAANRAIAAQHENTSVTVLNRLLRDPSHLVRKALLKRIPIKTQTQFSKWIKLTCPSLKIPITRLTDDPNPVLRSILAQYPKAGIRRLTRFASDPSWFVRACVALNPNTPAFLLSGILEKADEHVRDFLGSHLAKSNRLP